MNIDISNLAAEIEKELLNYSQEVTEQLKESIKQVAEETVTEIKNNSPSRTGKYRKGWKTKVAYEGQEDLRILVHNRTSYQLTHLLEYGYAKVNGGRVEGKKHIAPAEENAANKLINKVKVGLK